MNHEEKSDFRTNAMGGIFEIIDEDGIDRTITQKSTEENTLFVNELSRSSSA